MPEQHHIRSAPVHWSAQCGHQRLGSIRSVVVDISIHGFLLFCSEPLKMGDIVEMQVFVSSTETIECCVEIVPPRSDLVKASIYGARFRRVTHEGMQLLTRKLLEVRREAANRESDYQPKLFYQRARWV